MAMPKGFKSENGYGTSKLFDGMTYHQIADSTVSYTHLTLPTT